MNIGTFYSTYILQNWLVTLVSNNFSGVSAIIFCVINTEFNLIEWEYTLPRMKSVKSSCSGASRPLQDDSTDLAAFIRGKSLRLDGGNVST